MAKTRESAEEPGGVGFWGLCLPAGSLGPSLKDCFRFLLCTGGSAAARGLRDWRTRSAGTSMPQRMLHPDDKDGGDHGGDDDNDNILINAGYYYDDDDHITDL